MADFEFEARIHTKLGGPTVIVRVNASSESQARKLIEMKPEFKSFAQFPRRIK